MKQLTFYEQVGIVTPGAVFLFGMILDLPDLRNIFAKDGVSVGGLGVFVIISYAVGHLLAAFGNVIDKIHWKIMGGMPSDWIVGPTPRLLTESQIDNIGNLICSRLRLPKPIFKDLTIASWFPIFRQIYSDVEKHGKPMRADTFNGNYGLNRGLCAATFSLSFVLIIQTPTSWTPSAELLIAGIAYLYRMHRFGVHYAREVFNQFLLLPADPLTEKAKKKRIKSETGKES